MGYDQIVLRSGTQINYLITKAAMAVNQHIKIRAEIDSYETLALLVNAGMGIGVLPQQSADMFQIPHTHFVVLQDDWAQRDMLLAVRRKKDLSPSAQLLFSYLHRHDLAIAGMASRSAKHSSAYTPNCSLKASTAACLASKIR